MEMVDPKQDPAWGSFEVHKKNLSLAQNDGGERDGREESDTQEVPENDSIRGRGKRGRGGRFERGLRRRFGRKSW